MKIAIITVGNPNNKKGFFNNVNERIRHLQKESLRVDAFLIQHYNSFVSRIIKKKSKKQIKETYSYADGVKYKNLWVKLTLIDYLLVYKLKFKAIIGKRQLCHFVNLFKNYDLTSSHELRGIYLSSLIKEKYNIPFVATWHGSDINEAPFKNKRVFICTKTLLKNADYNFFVSNKLMEISDKIYKGVNKEVFYTGPAETFYKYDKEKKAEILTRLGVSTKIVIGFIGNLVPIKNVLILPDIFLEIKKNMSDVSFIIVGNGELSYQLNNKLKEYGIDNIFFLNKQEPNKIPDIMNSLDILVLPSLNEGMPRVALEALACGVHVVGSEVGGIPEAIGKKNAFVLDDNFVVNISNRITQIIENGEQTEPLMEKFSWDKAIEKEITVYNKIIKTILY